MRILVCGGRDYTDRAEAFEYLDRFYTEWEGNIQICHGGARGADSLAGEWATSKDVPCVVFPADWAKYGRRAGYVRNQQMLDVFKPELVIAFPGGKGTANMVKLARTAGIQTCGITGE